MLFGSIEAGGTKFVCAVGNEKYQILDSVHIPTTTPKETFSRCIKYFKKYPDMQAMGIASFGPIEIRQDAPKYGYITDTPKPNWANTNFLGTFKKAFNIPIFWTTDVNGSAYGEYITSIMNQRPLRSLVYYTIGTGCGGGIVNNGHFLGYMGHTELGHVRLKRDPNDKTVDGKPFKGICPYHGDCLEGLVSGPTFEKRCGKKGQYVPLTDPAWKIMAFYVAQAAIQATLFVRPQRIIFGGGVVSEKFLKMVRANFKKLFNNYLPAGDLNNYITMPQCPHNGSATVGDFALALRQYYKENIIKVD